VTAAAATPAAGPVRLLRRIGAATRSRASPVLVVAALAASVAAVATRPRSWRRPVRAEFRRALHQALAGGLPAVLVTAALVGIGLVFQGAYWLTVAGQDSLVGRVLVLVLVRELTPMLVGFILLGRSGTVAVVELGALQAGGQVRALEGQGLDPLLLFVLPRAVALIAASFTLGVFFVAWALLVGTLAGGMLGGFEAASAGPGAVVEGMLLAMSPADFLVFPLKLALIGGLVALTAAVTGLSAAPGEPSALLLPRGFVRGVLAVLLADIALGLAL
jgi:phospholipid/cholesterol/gamma-HCH transport system permease protein